MRCNKFRVPGQPGRLSKPTLHLAVVVFDCSSLAYVPAEANKKTATREKEKTPRMFCSELARDSCILTWIREERLPLLLPVSLFVQNRNFIPI